MIGDFPPFGGKRTLEEKPGLQSAPEAVHGTCIKGGDANILPLFL